MANLKRRWNPLAGVPVEADLPDPDAQRRLRDAAEWFRFQGGPLGGTLRIVAPGCSFYEAWGYRFNEASAAVEYLRSTYRVDRNAGVAVHEATDVVAHTHA